MVSLQWSGFKVELQTTKTKYTSEFRLTTKIISLKHDTSSKNLHRKFVSMDSYLSRIRALIGAPTPIAISLTPAESNFGLNSFNAEANSQLRTKANNPK